MLIVLLPEICKWLESTAVATAIRESTWLFPLIESTHVLAIVIVVGSIAMFDLRLLGIAFRDRTVSEVYEEVMPWTWTSFVCAAIAGSLLFSSSATKYYRNFPFRMKMLILLLIGINTAIFQFRTYPRVKEWDRALRTPKAARVAAGVSLVFWIFVVAFGRWIGFTK